MLTVWGQSLTVSKFSHWLLDLAYTKWWLTSYHCGLIVRHIAAFHFCPHRNTFAFLTTLMGHLPAHFSRPRHNLRSCSMSTRQRLTQSFSLHTSRFFIIAEVLRFDTLMLLQSSRGFADNLKTIRILTIRFFLNRASLWIRSTIVLITLEYIWDRPSLVASVAPNFLPTFVKQKIFDSGHSSSCLPRHQCPLL